LYADFFKRNQFEEAPIDGAESAEQPPVKGEGTRVPSPGGDEEQKKFLPFYKAERSGTIAVKALGLASIDLLPLVYAEEDAQKFALYVENNGAELKAFLPGSVEGKKQVLADVDRMFGKGLEARRIDILLRWFRDRATPADLNPMKLVEREAEANGSILQLLHPLLFNILFFGVSIIVIFLTFALFFRGPR
jgi:hypothetical protein